VGSGNFSLTKWYLDVVANDGGVAIAYWADVHWQRLHHGFCSLLLRSSESTSCPWRFSGRRVAPPRPDAQGVRWDAKPLELSAEFVRREPAFEHRLLEGAEGVIDWHCEVPRADVRLRIDDSMVEGTGYAERLELTVLPWRIPADEVRWGRFLAADTSIVWIDWLGDHPLHLIFHNGRLVPVTAISEKEILFENGRQLALTQARVINADVLGGLLAPLEVLRPIVEPITHVHQTRWLSRGALTGEATEARCGWALHELVRRQ
jgi:hypothetical protein